MNDEGMERISSSKCPQCGAPVSSNKRNQFCQHCGTELLNESIWFDEPESIVESIVGTTYLPVNIKADQFVSTMQSALKQNSRVFKEYIQLVETTDRKIIYIPIVFYRYTYYQAEWDGEVAVRQSDGSTITFPKSGTLNGTFDFKLVNTKKNQLPTSIKSILKLCSRSYDEISIDSDSKRKGQVPEIEGAYDPETSLIEHNDKSIKDLLIQDVKKQIGGFVESIRVRWNSRFECKIVYVPFWISTGNAFKECYGFLMNASTGKLSFYTKTISSYFKVPKYKGYRELCILLGVIDFFVPGESIILYLVVAGFLIPKLQPLLYKFLTWIVKSRRSYTVSRGVNAFDRIYRKGIVPLVYSISIAAFLYRILSQYGGIRLQ